MCRSPGSSTAPTSSATERFGCRIVDFKSGRYKGVAPIGDDHGDQLRVYAEAVRAADGRMPIAADLLYIGARRTRSVSLSRREMSATLEGFARAWVDLKHHVAERAFPATPSPLCGWCPLVAACPAAARDGRAARVDGLPSAAELGIPVLHPPGPIAPGPLDGEPRVITAADVDGYDPAGIPEPAADNGLPEELMPATAAAVAHTWIRRSRGRPARTTEAPR